MISTCVDLQRAYSEQSLEITSIQKEIDTSALHTIPTTQLQSFASVKFLGKNSERNTFNCITKSKQSLNSCFLDIVLTTLEEKEMRSVFLKYCHVLKVLIESPTTDPSAFFFWKLYSFKCLKL